MSSCVGAHIFSVDFNKRVPGCGDVRRSWRIRLKLTRQLLTPCRRWVLQQILRQCSAGGRAGSRTQQQQQQEGEAEAADAERGQQLSEHLARTLHQEIKVCCDAACRYPSNYNAWSHRIWVLQHMARGNMKVRGFPTGQKASLLSWDVHTGCLKEDKGCLLLCCLDD